MASATKVRGRDTTTRRNIGSFRNRTRRCSNSLPSAIVAVLILPFGDEARGRTQHVALGAEDRQRGVAARQEIADALPGAVDAELGDEGGLAERRILAGLFAERGGIALHVEQVVGDLE